MSDVQWQVVEVPILGTDESVDPALVPAGTIVDSLNTEYTTKGGTLRKRPGLDVRCTAAAALEIGMRGGYRLIKYKNQLLVVDYDGLVTIPTPLTSGYASVTTRLPTKTVRRNQMTVDFNGTTIGDVACAGNYVVHAIANFNIGGIAVKIVDVLSGSVVFRQTISNPDSFPVISIKAATSGSFVLILFATAGAGADNIYSVAYDCSVEPDSTYSASATLLKNDCVSGGGFGLALTGAVSSTPRWFFCYPNVNLKGSLFEVLSNQTIGWGYTDFDTSVVRGAMSCLHHGTSVWVNYFRDQVAVGAGDNSWRYACVNDSTGAVVQAPTDWIAIANIGADINANPVRSITTSAISGTSDPDKVLLLACQETKENTGTGTALVDHIIDGVPMLRWRTVTTAGPAGSSINQKRGPQLLAQPWRDLGTSDHYVWTAVQARYDAYRIYDTSVPEYAGPPKSMTACLLKLAETSSTAWLETTAAGEITNYAIQSNYLYSGVGTNLRYRSPASTSQDVDGNWHTVIDVEPLPREGQFKGTYPLTAPAELVVRSDHPGRFSSVEFGNSTYITGGLLMQYDGVAFFENNMVSPPVMATIGRNDGTGTGAWDTDWTSPASGVPIYRGIYESITNSGERVKSPVTYTCKSSQAPGASTMEVEVQFDPLTVTRRNPESAIDQFMPSVMFSLYRIAYESDSSFQKLPPASNLGVKFFESTPTAIVPSVVYDKGSTNAGATDPGVGTISNVYKASPVTLTNTIGYRIDSSELLYTDSGELENVLPYGGCTGIAVHQDRLWICGGEDQEIIWYSKPRAEGRVAEFCLEQQIRIPGRSVVALASMDQLIYAFCEDAVFAIEGSGPNAMGQEGFFSEPYPVTLAMGTTEPRSVISTPIGIFFRTQAGMYVIDRGTRIPVWIGQPMSDTFDLYPTVLSAKVVPEKTQVRFALGNDDGGILVVFDWEEQRWTKWQYTCMGFVSDMSVWDDHNTAILSTEGGLYEENYSKFLDDTTPYYAYAETGWLSFGSLQGFKRIRKTGLLLEKLGNHGLDVSMWFNYTKTGLSATKSFSSTEISAIQGPEWVRITMPYQKQPSVKLRLTETPYTDPLGDIPESAGFAWKSMAFEIGLMAGIKRLPQGQSK